MQIVKASTEIISNTPDLQKVIELGGRTCYKSEDKITEDSADAFIERIKNFKHESVLEHGSITVKFIIDRGVSHELVRHRLASFSQESTRYCNYSKNKFNNQISFIEPCFWSRGSYEYYLWQHSCELAEEAYFHLLDKGATPQQARAVLPNSLKTELIVTANPREWRHIFKVRCAPEAHPQMREIMLPLSNEFKSRWYSLFGDI